MNTGGQKPVTKRITLNITASKEFDGACRQRYHLLPNKKFIQRVQRSFKSGPSCSRPIGANPGLNFNRLRFSFPLKAFFQIIFSFIFRPSNYQTVDKKNSTQFAFLHFHI